MLVEFMPTRKAMIGYIREKIKRDVDPCVYDMSTKRIYEAYSEMVAIEKKMKDKMENIEEIIIAFINMEKDND